MKLPASIATINWRPVAGLFLAGLLGWLLAWFMLPSGSPSVGADGSVAKDKRPAAQAPAVVKPGVTAGESAANGSSAAQQGQTLDQLLKKQSAISEQAERSAGNLPLQPQPGMSAAAPTPAGKAVPQTATEANRAARIRAMQELQTKTIAEIQSVPPGDTKRMMAAMEHFDAQMRAAGAPSIIDMDKLRKSLEATNRIQELNRQLIAEAEKGRTADANKVRSLNQEILAMQKSMPHQFIKTDALQKQMTP
jgi:hypothetical protein